MQHKHTPTEMSKFAGKRILHIRRRQRLTREFVAEKAGISTQTVKRIEMGEACNIDAYEAIANVLKTPLHYFFGGELTETSTSLHAQRLYRMSLEDFFQMMETFKVKE